MIDINSIASQVKHNCNISDATFWGYYSPCSLLLRLRDLYMMENEMKPWENIDDSRIREWISDCERKWRELEGHDFRKITINGRSFRPFDVKRINELLVSQGYFYGAGYGNSMKPLFLLAELSEERSLKKCKIYVTGREFARDLSASPAMIRGSTVLARRETAHFFFWGKLLEMRSGKCAGALYHAFSEYGIKRESMDWLPFDRLIRLFEQLVREEISTCISHEVGEASQRRALGRWWKELITTLPHGRAVLFLRSLKDILADTCKSGMIPHIIKNRNAGSLGFYVALLSGFRETIFPEIVEAYNRFLNTRDWRVVEKARKSGYYGAMDMVEKLKGRFEAGHATAEAIEHDFLQGNV